MKRATDRNVLANLSRLGHASSRRLTLFALPILAALAATASAFAQSPAEPITVDTATLTVTGDGEGDDKAFKGVPFEASVEDGVATFYLKGDLNVAATDSVTAVGPNAASLVAGDDANVSPGANFDVSASGATPGPGGGGGGGGGEGGRSVFSSESSYAGSNGPR